MLLMYSVYLTIHFRMLFYSPFSYAFDGIVPGHGRSQRLDIEPNLRQPHNHIDYIHSMGPIWSPKMARHPANLKNVIKIGQCRRLWSRSQGRNAVDHSNFLHDRISKWWMWPNMYYWSMRQNGKRCKPHEWHADW